jgi:small subunit ribosomal protein S3
MGHKSNPIGLRLQINRTWDSRWYAEGRSYGKLLEEDLKMRKFIVDTLPQAAISKVVIERPAKLCRVSIYAARPGVIIGKKGAARSSSTSSKSASRKSIPSSSPRALPIS